MKRSLLPVLTVVMMVALMVFVPLVADSSDADTVKCNGVTISTYSGEKKIAAGNTSDLDISVFNNNSDYSSVELTYTKGSNPIEVKYSTGDLMIKGNTGEILKATFIVDKYAPQDKYALNMTAKVMNNTGIIETAELTVVVDVTSAYSSGSAFNKILGLFDNPLPSPMNDPLVTAGISLALWVAIAFIAYAIYNTLLNVILKNNKDECNEIKKKTDKLVVICVILFGISNCLRILGADEKITAIVFDISLLLYIGLGAIIAWGVYKVIVSHLFHKMETDGRLDGVDTSLIPLFFMIGKIFITIIAVAWMLSVLGFNLVAILTGAGIAGLAISLGAQSTLNEFFSGLTLLITRPFKANDMIRLGTGTEILEVKRVGLMNSEFKNWANYEHFTMPNSAVVKSTIVNLTGKTHSYRIFLYFGVAYDSDLELVKKLMKDSAYEHPQVITDGSFDKPDVRLTSFDNSCITLRLAAYINDFEDNGVISGELREAVFKKFNDNGIEIPFDQLDVHIKHVDN